MIGSHQSTSTYVEAWREHISGTFKLFITVKFQICEVFI